MNRNEKTWWYCPTNLMTDILSAASLFGLESSLKNNLQLMYDYFGSNVFLLHHAQGFLAHAIQRAYDEEEASFMKTARVVSRDVVVDTANINSLMFYIMSKLMNVVNSI